MHPPDPSPSELERALDTGRVRVAYQPQVDLATGAIVGVEALARWDRPILGAVNPECFIALAERSRLIGRLGRFVLDASCRTFAGWRTASPAAPGTLMINVSPHQLVADLVDDVEASLALHRVAPGDLVLEITESGATLDDEALAVLEALAGRGVRLAIDDFGTGHSSMVRLRRLPWSVLKVDRSFTHDLTTDPRAHVLVTWMLGLADALGLTTVVEGVEQQDQADELARLGARVVQGFLFAPALPADEVLARCAVGPQPWLSSGGVDGGSGNRTGPWLRDGSSNVAHPLMLA